MSDPLSCPTCGALIKNTPPLDVGLAKSLVLLASGAKAEIKEHGTVERFLDRFTRTAEDVDALVALAGTLDPSEKARACINEAAGASKAAYDSERQRCLQIAAEHKN